MTKLTHPQIAVLDYGSQVTHLLARAIRQHNVYSEILEPETPIDQLKNYKGIILSGGPSSVYEEGAPQVDPAIFALGIPILGICYGHQLMCHYLGGKVEPGDTQEYGKAILEVKSNTGILDQFSENENTQIWMSHGDTVSQLPDGFSILASTSDCETAVIGDPNRNFYGIQFHPEVKHSLKGMQMLDSFLKICQCERDWQLPDYLAHKIEQIKTQAGDKNVFLLISGGVDSTVAFALLNKALDADRVHGLLVDTGFMREGEVRKVTAALKGMGVKHLTVNNAAAKYYQQLKEVYAPEEKRKIIGKIFIEVKEQVSADLGLNDDEWLLGQGTIYPDTIESGGTKHADKIKTHHNRIDHIQELIDQGKVIEPLVDLYKDEVREIGKILGLDAELVNRHPFPGPGLAVRTLCLDKAEKIVNKEEVSAEVAAFIADKGLDLKSQILPIKSVGVQGDGRTYRHPLAIETVAISSVNFQELLDLTTDLANNFKAINRVILRISAKPITVVKPLEGRYLTEDRISVLQKADALFTNMLQKHNQYNVIWQAPVVLAPVSIDGTDNESIVLRPVSSTEAMTADAYPLPIELLNEYVNALESLKLPISGVFYDLTHKPPGTIEWE